MRKNFKNQKNPTWGPFWVLFAKMWAKMNFPGKKGSASFSMLDLSTIMPKTIKT